MGGNSTLLTICPKNSEGPGQRMHARCCKQDESAGITEMQVATKKVSNLGYEVNISTRLTVWGKVRL